MKDSLESKISLINSLISEVRKIKEDNPELKNGHYMSYGSLLNSYREGDVGFDECVELMKQVNRKPLPQRTKHLLAEISTAVERFEDNK